MSTSRGGIPFLRPEMTPPTIEIRETRGRKRLAPDKKRERVCYTLPTELVANVQLFSARCEVPASRFVEFAIETAMNSIDDLDVRAVKEAAKRK